MKEWIAIIIPLLTAIVGLLLGGFGRIFYDYYKQKQLSRQILKAFQAEIKSLKNILERLQYIEDLENKIQKLKRTGQSELFLPRIKEDYFNIYRSQIANIGLLEKELPELITTFYTYLKSFIETVNGLQEDLEFLKNPTISGIIKQNSQIMISGYIKTYEELLALLHELVRIGHKIIEYK